MGQPIQHASAIVPRNNWHTARIHGPAEMLFITPGEGTENREEPPRKG